MTLWHDVFDRFGTRIARRLWKRRLKTATSAPLHRLRRIRTDAQIQRAQLNQLIGCADERLTLPSPDSQILPPCDGASWIWRPDLWRTRIDPAGRVASQDCTVLSHDAKLFHDGADQQVVFRQLRNATAQDLAPYSARIEVFDFSGGFVSLAISPPPDGIANLTRHQILRVQMIYDAETPAQIYARLNLRYGPDTETITRRVAPQNGHHIAEFDLGFTGLHDESVDNWWLDIILENPLMTSVRLRDLVISRLMRADL